jgi:hypothetical protein
MMQNNMQAQQTAEKFLLLSRGREACVNFSVIVMRWALAWMIVRDSQAEVALANGELKPFC